MTSVLANSTILEPITTLSPRYTEEHPEVLRTQSPRDHQQSVPPRSLSSSAVSRRRNRLPPRARAPVAMATEFLRTIQLGPVSGVWPPTVLSEGTISLVRDLLYRRQRIAETIRISNINARFQAAGIIMGRQETTRGPCFVSCGKVKRPGNTTRYSRCGKSRYSSARWVWFQKDRNHSPS